jgi:hypothetical protein
VNGGQPVRAQLQFVVEENGRLVLAPPEMRRANRQLGAEVGGLKLWVEVLEQDSRLLSEAT